MGINLSKQTINLSKNQTINLSKESQNDGLSDIKIALGWDPVEKHGYGIKGFFETLFNGEAEDIDCDAWVALYGSNERHIDTVYFNNLVYSNPNTRKKVIEHHGDNLTGAGKGDNEVITISLKDLPPEVTRITIGVTIYQAISRRQSFDCVKNVFIRVVDNRDNFEICRFENVTINEYRGAITFYAGDLRREMDGTWNFCAVGTGDRSPDIRTASEVARTGRHLSL